MADPTIKYTGDGNEYHPYIPARHLTADDYAALDNDQRAIVRNSPIYDYASYKSAGDKAKAKDAAASSKAAPSAPVKDGDLSANAPAAKDASKS